MTQSPPLSGSGAFCVDKHQRKKAICSIRAGKRSNETKMSSPFLLLNQEVPATVRVAQVVGITGAAFLAGTVLTLQQHTTGQADGMINRPNCINNISCSTESPARSRASSREAMEEITASG
jgi:hypothetical protein